MMVAFYAFFSSPSILISSVAPASHTLSHIITVPPAGAEELNGVRRDMDTFWPGLTVNSGILIDKIVRPV